MNLDLADLQIYSRIKTKLRGRNSDIRLLFPNKPHKRISTHIKYHYIHWDLTKTLYGLKLEDFSKNNSTEVILNPEMTSQTSSFNFQNVQ